MSNQISGPFGAISITAGVTAINKTWGENAQTQASIALHGINPDLSGPFILTGCQASGTVGTSTVNIASGTAYITVSDGTTARVAVGSATQTTSALSSTYNLYLQPDGTWYWSTSNSPASNSLAIATVATDGAGKISSITDLRHTAGGPGVPLIVARTIDQAISSTSLAHVLSYSVPVNGLYRISAAFYIGRSGTSVITFSVQANAGDNPAIVPSYQFTLQGGSTLNALAMAGAGQWTIMPSLFFAAAGYTLDVYYTDATATVADKVSVIVERVS